MAKYLVEFKLKVVTYYLSGHGGLRLTGKDFGIDPAMLRKWVSFYQQHGIDGLKRRKKHTKYSEDFKRMVLQFIDENMASYRAAAAKFNLPNVNMIVKWRKHLIKNDMQKNIIHENNVGTIRYKPEKLTLARLNHLDSYSKLSKELEISKAEIAYLRKIQQINCLSPCVRDKVIVVSELRNQFPLKQLLVISGLARSTFYYHINNLTKPDKYKLLKEQIKTLFIRHKGCYGYRRIVATIRNNGHLINHKTIQRLMKELGLKSIFRPKKYKSFRGNEGVIVRNLLKRNFYASSPNQKWVTDVIQFDVSGKKLYLSPIMDLFNGEIISYRISQAPVFKMVREMIFEAVQRLNWYEKPILHSDQGWQYQMKAYQKILTDRNITPSMSRRSNCLDNAALENFFGILISECFYTQKFQSVTQLENELHEYIKYYNCDRIKLKLGGLSPIDYRKQKFQCRSK